MNRFLLEFDHVPTTLEFSQEYYCSRDDSDYLHSMVPYSFCNQSNVLKVLIPFPYNYSSYPHHPYKLPDQQSQFLNATTAIPFQFHRSPMSANPQKQLRRLPQVFSKILELPLQSHADVFIENRSDCFRFTANIEDNTFSGKVRAHAVKMHKEVTKVVVRGGLGNGGRVAMDKLEVDVWRFRLPETTRPELATAVVVGRKLTVTVPKGGRGSYGGKVEESGGEWRLIPIE